MVCEFFILKGILKVGLAGSFGLCWGSGASCFEQGPWVG